MKKRSKESALFRASLVCGALLAAAFSTSAGAQGWYVGGSVGTAKMQDYDIAGPYTRADDSDTAMRVFGGYLVNRRQGFVASYIDLGTPRYAGSAFGGFTDALSADGVDVSYIIGFAPGRQERVNLFGTMGVFSWSQDVDFTDDTGSYHYKDEGTSLSLGLGTEIRLGAGEMSPWGINVSWQLFKDVGDLNNSGHQSDRDTLTVGAHYRFGGK